MATPQISVRPLAEYPLTMVPTPVVDVAFGSITAVYTTFSILIASSGILILANYTNQMVDYTLSGGISTQGHLASGSEPLILQLKSNDIPGSGSISVGFKATTTLPTTGFCSISNMALP